MKRRPPFVLVALAALAGACAGSEGPTSLDIGRDLAPANGVTCFGFPATIVGTDGPDVIQGTPGNDVIHALGGDDVVFGNGGRDIICGGDGDDHLYGSNKPDRIDTGDGINVAEGGGGKDFLLGGAGPDSLRGGPGNDTLNGGAGDNVLEGGDHNDRLIGGIGADHYSGGDGMDVAKKVNCDEGDTEDGTVEKGVEDCGGDPPDSDMDGIANADDNCPGSANPLQEDADMDGIGDACDPIDNRFDTDGDGVLNGDDNCPVDFNDTQLDSDFDGIGDACDPMLDRAYAIPYAPDGQPANYAGDLPGTDHMTGGELGRYSIVTLPIGFTFTFFGTDYTQVHVTPDGYLQFTALDGATQSAGMGQAIPSPGYPDGIIAAGWYDMVESQDAADFWSTSHVDPTAYSSGIWYETRGMAPNRRLVVSFNVYGFTGGWYTGEIILYEGTNVIEVHTLQLEGEHLPHLSSDPNVVTQGVENADGTVAHFLPGRVQAASMDLLSDGVRFITN